MNSANVLIKIFALLFLLLPSDARAQQSTPLQGSWTASVGPTDLRGTNNRLQRLRPN